MYNEKWLRDNQILWNMEWAYFCFTHREHDHMATCDFNYNLFDSMSYNNINNSTDMQCVGTKALTMKVNSNTDREIRDFW